MTEIKESETLKEKLKNEGNVTYLDQPEHLAAMGETNKLMEASRREFQIKDRNSQLKASEMLLTD